VSKTSAVSTINRVRSRLAAAEAALREAVTLLAEADACPDRAALERVASHVAAIRTEVRQWTIGIALGSSPLRTGGHGSAAVRARLSAGERDP
jgi:hypothetical protein